VQDFCTRVVVLRSGRIEEQGLTDQTLVHPTTDYTRRPLAAVPVPDPIVQRRRRKDRLVVLAAGEMGARK
jgi:peptide/nickel transport system ATP-binding protein